MAKAELMNYEQALEKFEVVIGLEVHVELNTKTKMFCGCKNDFGDEPNTNVCPICIGLPGSLPVVNKRAIESSIAIGLALGCSIAPTGRFARKNYFYPDLAKNYQTSQYDEPIAFEGSLEVEVPSGKSSPLASNVLTWKRTPASSLTWVAPPVASTELNTRWLTTTAPVFHWSKSSRNQSSVLAQRHLSWPLPTCAAFARSSRLWWTTASR